eukprot:COSAG06_NODE_13090_length_1289_cov_1.133891_1_plen_79_part_00
MVSFLVVFVPTGPTVAHDDRCHQKPQRLYAAAASVCCYNLLLVILMLLLVLMLMFRVRPCYTLVCRRCLPHATVNVLL